MYDNNIKKLAPVKEGDIISLKIEALGEKGDGIGKKEGFVIIVPNTKPEDRIKVKITKVLRSVAFGESVGNAEDETEVDTEVDAEVENIEPAEPIEDTEDF